MTEKSIPMRLALRVEGDWWVAYAAMPNTMDDAIELGRVRMAVVGPNENIRDMFKEAMTEFVRLFIKEKFGVDADMVQSDAPEHERGGHA